MVWMTFLVGVNLALTSWTLFLISVWFRADEQRDKKVVFRITQSQIDEIAQLTVHNLMLRIAERLDEERDYVGSTGPALSTYLRERKLIAIETLGLLVDAFDVEEHNVEEHVVKEHKIKETA